ncbi:MAG: site-specific DNA-methyltransferase [Candidatus Marinimicrobia bacterium]|nr:site-specific DNA-methyltransferase [Candidatus Neomarinimicrobiota bacterium]
MKLLNGDCIEMMDGLISERVTVDAIITDPPYGITACEWDIAIPFDDMWERLNKLTKSNGAIVLFGAEPFSSELRLSNIKNYKYDWVWTKNLKSGHLNARKMPMRGHEMIHIFYNKPVTYNPQKRKRTTEHKSGNKFNSKTGIYGKQKDVYIDRQNDEISPDTVLQNIKCVSNDRRVHPTQKPVALIEYLIKTYTNENEIVLDFTMGSGTTGVACKNLNRDFIGIEMDTDYFEIAKQRIQSVSPLTDFFEKD